MQLQSQDHSGGPARHKIHPITLVLLAAAALAVWIIAAHRAPTPRQPPIETPVAQPATISSESPSPPSTDKKIPTLEYKLAVIDTLSPVGDDDIALLRFRYLLKAISARSGYTQQQIADLSVYARDSIRKDYGRDVKVLQIMEEIKQQLDRRPKTDLKLLIIAVITYHGQ